MIGHYMPMEGVVNGVDLMDLKKSLLAGDPIGNSASGGPALQLESVDGYVQDGTFSEKQMVLFRTLRSAGCIENINSTLKQAVLRTSIGSLMDPVALGETGVPPVVDSELQRILKYLRPLSTMVSYSEILELLGTNIIQPTSAGGQTGKDEALRAGTLRLLMHITNMMWHGDPDINANEPNGIFKQIADATEFESGINDYDLHGKAPTAELLKFLASQLSTVKLGYPDTIVASLDMIEGVSRQMQPMVRSESGKPIVYGAPVNGIIYHGGTLSLLGDPFLAHQRMPLTTAASNSGAPSTPTISSVAASGSDSYFQEGDLAIYKYKVIAQGATGFSAPTAASDAVDVDTAGKSGRVTLNDSGVTNVTQYFVFRSEAGGAGTYRFAYRQAKASSGHTTLVDSNYHIPGTEDIFITAMHPDYVRFSQITEVKSLPQPISGFLQKAMIFTFGTPFCARPHQLLRLRNAAVPAFDPLV